MGIKFTSLPARDWNEPPTATPLEDLRKVVALIGEGGYGENIAVMRLPSNLEEQSSPYLHHIFYFHEKYYKDDWSGDWPAIISRVIAELERRGEIPT